jgi:tripartite-type tricarboxylate transporter receptor subunit TctC
MKQWICALVLAIASITGAIAQTYPSRPITLVVPLGVGGSTDVIGRLMGEGMRQHLGSRSWWRTHRRGRDDRRRPCRARGADGYTFLIGQWGTNVASGAIYPLQFDLEKDFEPISLIATSRS